MKQNTYLFNFGPGPNSILHTSAVESVGHSTWSWYSNKENPPSHLGGTCKDGHQDGQTDRVTDQTLSYIPQFHLGGAGNNNIKINAT